MGTEVVNAGHVCSLKDGKVESRSLSGDPGRSNEVVRLLLVQRSIQEKLTVEITIPSPFLLP